MSRSVGEYNLRKNKVFLLSLQMVCNKVCDVPWDIVNDLRSLVPYRSKVSETRSSASKGSAETRKASGQ